MSFRQVLPIRAAQESNRSVVFSGLVDADSELESLTRASIVRITVAGIPSEGCVLTVVHQV